VHRTDRSRRRLLAGLAGAPLAGAAAVAAARLGAHAGTLRPGARGSSDERCAQCGSSGHTMLDASCPASPEVV
jgi:hypothetical protein